MGFMVHRPFFPPFANSVSVSVDNYVFGGLSAPLVADHAGVNNNGTPFYRKQGSTTTFSGLFGTRYDRSDAATLFDSSGNLVWNCHNFMRTNVVFSNFSGATVTNSNAPDPNGDSTFDTLADDGTGGSGGVSGKFSPITLVSGTMSWGMIVTEPTTRYFFVAFGNITSTQGRVIFDWDTDAATETGSNVLSTSLTDLGGGFKLARVVWDATGADVTGNGSVGFAVNPTGNPNNVPKDGTNSMTVGAPRANRAFGTSNGMAPVPADVRTFSVDDSYIAPVTTAARFLSRRENHRFNGTSWVLAGHRVEPAATNDVTYSRDFSNAAWSKSGCTVTQDAAGIDGETSAFTMEAISTSCRVAETFTVSTSTAYTFSVVAKAGTEQFLILVPVSFTTPGNVYTFFDLGAGSVVSAGTGITANIQPLGNGFYRCSITFTTHATDTVGDIWIMISKNGSATTCDVGDTIIITDAQMEAGDITTSIIPTNGSAVTRATDVTSGQVLAADAPSDTTAVFYAMHGRVSYADNAAVTEIDFYERRVDADNALLARLDTSGTNTGVIQGEQEAATVVDTADGNSELTPGVDVAFKFSVRHTSGAIQVANNGVAGAENSTPTALADLSTATLDLCGAFTGNVEMIVSGTGDPGSAGIVEAST